MAGLAGSGRAGPGLSLWPGLRPVKNPPNNQHQPSNITIPFIYEPSLLGLKLRKNHSLLDFIQVKLSRATTLRDGIMGRWSRKGYLELLRSSRPPTFLPGSKIGSWEYKSRHEVNLFASYLKMDGKMDGPETLDVLLARQHLFFRRQIHNPGSTHCGKQLLILLENRPAYSGHGREFSCSCVNGLNMDASQL